MFNKLVYKTINVLKNQKSIKFTNKVLKTKNSNIIIKDSLYIGNIIDAHNLSFIIDNNISSILNCTENQPFHQYFMINYSSDNYDNHILRLPIKDSRDEENINAFFELLDTGVEFIHKNIKTYNKIVYVHCYWGLMRSATVVAAYLIKYHGYTVDGAITYVKECRPYSFSSFYNFRDLLEKYNNNIINKKLNKNDEIDVSVN
jgi:protein-tyrosine phosphatase